MNERMQRLGGKHAAEFITAYDNIPSGVHATHHAMSMSGWARRVRVSTQSACAFTHTLAQPHVHVHPAPQPTHACTNTYSAHALQVLQSARTH